MEILQPKLRFPGFKQELQVRVIGDVCNLTTGNKDTQNKIDDGKYPFFVRSQTVERIDSYSYDGEAILTSGDGVGVGKNFHYINGKFDFHQRVYCLNKFKDDVYGQFVFHYFSENFLRRITRMNAKNSVDSVRREMIFEMPILLPNLNEQTKIANFLSSIDEKINLLKEKKSLLEEYKKGMMQKIFNQEIRFKDDNGNDFEDWRNIELGEVLDYIQPTKFIVKSTDYNDNFNIPVLTAGKTFILGYTNETDNIFKDKLPVIIFDDFTTANKFVDFPFKVKSSAMKILICNNKSADIKYIYEFIQTLNFGTGDEHKRYWISEYSKCEIDLPCIEEQIKIANFLSAIDEKIALVATQIEDTQEYKKGLLQQMFV
jgi:type I restriction enzyme, S subunit